VLRFYNGSSWANVATGTSGTADAVYNAGAWSVTIDSGDVGFDLGALDNAVKIYANITGTQVAMLVLDAEHTSSAVTDAISLTTTGGSAAITDAIDASDAGITNALNAGGNKIVGTTTTIDFTDFDVSADGAVTLAGDSNTDMILLSPGAATADGLDASDGNLTNAVNVGANTITGTTAVIDFTNFDVSAAGVVTVGSNLSVGGNLAVTGTFNSDALAAATSDTALSLDGNGTGGVTLNATGTGAITLTTATTASSTLTVTDDLTVNGGDITAPSSTASKPVLWLENTADDATCPTLKLENDRATETDGDDLGVISFYGSDSADGALEFVKILAEANEVNNGDEAGKLSITMEVNDSATQFLQMFGDTTNSSTGHFEINSGAVDVDFHYDGNDQADLVLFNAGDNGIVITRNLAAGATTAAEVLSVDQTSATADNGAASFTNAAAASATEPTVTIQSSATAFDQPSLFVNHDATAGATTLPAVLVDSEAVDTAGMIVKATTDGTGSVASDQAVLAVIAEGVGGAIDIGRNVQNTTHPALNILCDHADDAYEAIRIIHDGDATIAAPVVGIESTSNAMDEPHIELIQDDDTAASAAVLQFTKDNDGGEADGDDLGSIRFVGDDSGDAEHEFGYILFEAADVTATKEAGKMSVQLEVNDTDTAFLGMFGDAGDVTTAHFEINSGAADIDFHLDGNDQADLITTNADTDTITFNLSQTDSQLLINHAEGTGTTGEELIFINDDRTGGNADQNTEATIVIDAEGSHALYVMDGVAEFADTCVFTGGQTRKVILSGTDQVLVDGTNPPADGVIGTDGQKKVHAWQFEAAAGADDIIFLNWIVPDGYVTDSARLNVYWSYDTAETDDDDVVFDMTVDACAPGLAAAPGDTIDGAGTAFTEGDTNLDNGDSDNGKLIVTQLNIEVEEIVVDDLVTIMFWVDASETDLDASGTVDVHYFEIEYESTE
jgi:hypothetical protein